MLRRSAAAATGRSDWATAAVGIGEFLLAELRTPDTGRWLRSWQEGRARHLAYAGDYAWLVDLFTRLAELTGEPQVVNDAVGRFALWGFPEVTDRKLLPGK